MTATKSTRDRLLDLAQELAQVRGLNGFSFQDLAHGVGIRTASVHHHFRTKEDLARELMARYRTTFHENLSAIDERHRSPRRKLERFAELFLETLRQGNRLCLCGRLATDYATLSSPVQTEVKAFFAETEEWLRATLEEGRRAGELRFAGAAAVVARTFLATLEGAMISARTFADDSRLTRAGSWMIAAMVPERSAETAVTRRRGKPRETTGGRGPKV